MSKRKRIEAERLEAEQISRRRFLQRLGLAGATTLLAGSGLGYLLHKSSPPIYSEAYEDEAKRDAWLQGLASRPYVTKRIATPEMVVKLNSRYHNNIQPDATAITIALDEENAGNGSRSELYVLPMAFDRYVKEFREGMGVITENIIENHELLHADHNYSGIPGYPLDLFRNKDGGMNRPLFIAATEIIGHKSEYQSLLRKQSSNPLVREYLAHFKRLLIQPIVSELERTADNKPLVKRLIEEAQF